MKKQDSGMKLFIISAFSAFIPSIIIWAIFYNNSKVGDNLMPQEYRWVIVASLFSFAILVCILAKILKIQRLNSLTITLPIIFGFAILFLWQDKLETLWLVISMLSSVFVSMILIALIVSKIENFTPSIVDNKENIDSNLWTKKEKKEVKDFIEF